MPRILRTRYPGSWRRASGAAFPRRAWERSTIRAQIRALCGFADRDGSHALRGNPSGDALLRYRANLAMAPWVDAERPGMHSHAERGNDQV